jgi:hypothetical protein
MHAREDACPQAPYSACMHVCKLIIAHVCMYACVCMVCQNGRRIHVCEEEDTCMHVCICTHGMPARMDKASARMRIYRFIVIVYGLGNATQGRIRRS